MKTIDNNEVQSNRNAQGQRKKADNFRGKFVIFWLAQHQHFQVELVSYRCMFLSLS